MVLKGSVAVYKNAWLYKLFLVEALSTFDADNILQENLFIILSYAKIIALTRLMSIIHLSVNVPIWWLAGKTHTLSAHDWFINSMVRYIDFFYNDMLKLNKYGWNILDEQFMFNIFKPLTLKPIDDYFKYIFGFKNPTVSNTGKRSLERKSKSHCSTQPANIINQRHCLWSN